MKSVVNKRACLIYALSDPRDVDIVRYVGKTVQKPAKRLAKHIMDASSCKQPNHRTNWIRSLLAVGVSPVMRILEVVDPVEEFTAERRWIASLKIEHPLVNGTDGGQGQSGRVLSDATKRKIGIANSNRAISVEHRQKISKSNKGRRHSVEARRKISEALKGHIVSLESRRKSSVTQKGCVISAECRQKISETLKGHVQSAETRRKRIESMKKYFAHRKQAQEG